MHPEEKERLIIALQEHVNNITNLRYGNYLLAESLRQRTKRLASKYFPDRSILTNEIDKINFKLSESRENYKIDLWNESYRSLLTVSQAMLDEAQSPSEHTNNIIAFPFNGIHKFPEEKEKKIFAATFLAMASLILWTFNTWVKWKWLTYHPKKVAIYLSFQVAILFMSSLFFTNDKQVRFIEWLSIGVAIALAVISLLF